jgi:hypothetical protein
METNQEEPDMALFEGYERRIEKISMVMDQYGIPSLEGARKLCEDKGVDVYAIVRGIQPICFENACWAYILGGSIAIKKGETGEFKLQVHHEIFERRLHVVSGS